jgi:hypothetical protein
MGRCDMATLVTAIVIRSVLRIVLKAAPTLTTTGACDAARANVDAANRRLTAMKHTP